MDWSIKVTEDFIKELKKRGIYKRIKKALDDLEEMLRKDPYGTVRMLYHNPIIFSVGEYPARRYSIGKYRLFYIILPGERLIVFFDIKPRRKAYKKK